MSKISCIVVAYKSDRFHQKLLDSLNHQSVKPQELIFVDNSYSDITRKFCKKNNIKYYPLKNIGYGQACNFGSEKAKGTYLLFLNPDLILQPNLIEEFEKQTNEKIGLASCLVKSYNGRIITNDYGKISPLGSPIKANESDNQLVNGCTIFCKKSFFKSIGGFSSNYFLYGEDTDLALRSLSQGKQNTVLKSTCVWHYGGGSQNNPLYKIPFVIKAIISILIKKTYGFYR